MAVVDALRHVHEIIVCLEVGALDITVAPLVRAQHGYSPAVFHQAGRELDAIVVHAVVAHAVPYAAAAFGVEALGGDVDSAAERGSRENGSTQTALSLDIRCNVAQTGPVAPVYPAAFHIVDGNTVYHHGHIGALETAHVDFGIAEAAAVLGGPYTGRCVQNFGKLLCAELHVDFSLVHLRQCHRGLACAGKRLGHNHVLEHFARRNQLDGAHIGLGGNCGGIIAYIRDCQRRSALGNLDIELPVDIGGCQCAAVGYDDAGAYYRFAFLVYDRSFTI